MAYLPFKISLFLVCLMLACSSNNSAISSDSYSSEFARAEFQEPIKSSMVYMDDNLFFSTNDNEYVILKLNLESGELDTLLNALVLHELGIELANTAIQFDLSSNGESISLFNSTDRSKYIFDANGNLIQTIEDKNSIIGGGSSVYSVNRYSVLKFNRSARQEYMFEILNLSSSFSRGDSFFSYESHPELKNIQENFMLKTNPVFAESPDHQRQFISYQFSSWIFKRNSATNTEKIIREPFDKDFPKVEPIHMDDGAIAYDSPNAAQHISHILDLAANDQYLFAVYSGKTINEQGRLFFSGLSEDRVWDIIQNTGDSILIYDIEGNYLGHHQLPYRVYSMSAVADQLYALAFDDDFVVYSLDINSLVEGKVE